VSCALVLGAVAFISSPASAAPDPKGDIEVDVVPAPPPPLPALPPKKAPHDEPPTPANPHTELQSAPPTADQGDQWPVVPKGKEASGLSYPIFRPYASITGGVTVDIPYQYQIGKEKPSNFADRVSTIMISDFGLRGALLPWLSFESELMANGGISLHGTSVFEGQASLQVR